MYNETCPTISIHLRSQDCPLTWSISMFVHLVCLFVKYDSVKIYRLYSRLLLRSEEINAISLIERNSRQRLSDSVGCHPSVVTAVTHCSAIPCIQVRWRVSFYCRVHPMQINVNCQYNESVNRKEQLAKY